MKNKVKERKAGTMVECPVCKKITDARGLNNHLRLMHPFSDIDKERRKVIVKRPKPGERILLQVIEQPDGTWKIQHVTFNSDDFTQLLDVFTEIKKNKGIANCDFTEC